MSNSSSSRGLKGTRRATAVILGLGLALAGISMTSAEVGVPLTPLSNAVTVEDRPSPDINPNQRALRAGGSHKAASRSTGMTVRSAAYPDSAIISNGTVQLGINPAGHLNVWGGAPSSGGTGAVGLRYVPTNADATAPGCLCEGWGVAVGEVPGANPHAGTAGYANVDSDFGAHNLEVVEFSNTDDSARSVVDVMNGGGTPVMRVTHDYAPFPGSANLYRAVVTIENLTGSPIGDLLYRRVMDWDVEPTAFDEYVTIDGDDSSEFLRYSSDDGFASANPLAGPSSLGADGFFTDEGPADHGALFDFGFGSLAPLESQTFSIFYGGASNEENAVDAVSAAQAEVWSFGQPNTEGGPSVGAPNTFIFGFSGIGGAGAGTDARHPVTLATSAPTRLPVGGRDFDATARLDNTSDADISAGSVRIDPGPDLSLVEGANPATLGPLGAGSSGDGPSTDWALRTPAPLCASDQTFEYDIYGDFTGSGEAGGERHVERSITVPRTCGRAQGEITYTTGVDSGIEPGAQLSVCPAAGAGDCRTATSDGDGRYAVGELAAGEYVIDARPDPFGPNADLPPQRKTVQVPAGGTVNQHFELTSLIPPPADGSSGVDPETGGGTTDDGFPLIFWGDPVHLTTTPSAPCANPVVTYAITQGDPVVVTLARGPMAEGPPGTFKAVAPALLPNVGYARVTFSIDCPGSEPDPDPVEFNIYIDPSGFVRTVGGEPIAGATVTLLRSDSATGPFAAVPNNSTVMSPANRTNPDTTNSAGHFGWDVIAGYYKVRAEKAGCHAPGSPSTGAVESVVYEIPPPVTDVDLRLSCPAIPTGPPVTPTLPSGTPPPPPGPGAAPPPAAPPQPAAGERRTASCAALKRKARAKCQVAQRVRKRCGSKRGRQKKVCAKRIRAIARCKARPAKTKRQKRNKIVCLKKSRRIGAEKPASKRVGAKKPAAKR